MKNSAQKSIRAGEKVACDAATQNTGKVLLGDAARIFVRPISSGDKVARDAATKNDRKVLLGDAAPLFGR
jgi:hypothetical protein